jgi:hypothetical protein
VSLVIADWVVAVHQLNDDLSEVKHVLVGEVDILLRTSTVSFVCGWVLLRQGVEPNLVASHRDSDLVWLLRGQGDSLSDLSDEAVLLVLKEALLGWLF